METNYIYFGPKNTGSVLEQLRLPETITKAITTDSSKISATLTIHFNGERLSLTSIQVQSGLGIMTSDLIKLQIPKIMREVVYEHNPELHSLIASGATDKISVSQLYWAEHVCGGRPRELFRSQLGIARTTANYHLRRFETLGLVPKTKERSTRR